MNVPLTDGRIHYVSETSPEAHALWERAEKNRQAFLGEVSASERERLWSLVDRPDELPDLSPAAAAHVRFCWAVSYDPEAR